jgi:tRNA pseudouridine55 synthase
MESGILLVNKPKGITSNKLVLDLKKKLNISKIGHTGILDFSATGLLVILIGKATRLAEYLQKVDKEYIAIGKLGEFRNTYDISGQIIYKKECFRTIEQIKSTINSFIGEYDQLPPPYSSKKIKGVRAYKLAKKGLNPDLKPVRVKIYNIDILDIALPFFKIKVACSSGTYIRSLIKDIGDKLKCGAYMHSLTRTKVGNFSLDKAIDYNIIKDLSKDEILNYLIPMEKALDFMPSLHLTDKDEKNFIYGRHIFLTTNHFIDKNETLIKVLNSEGKFLGIGKIKNKILKPEKVFVR